MDGVIKIYEFGFVLELRKSKDVLCNTETKQDEKCNITNSVIDKQLLSFFSTMLLNGNRTSCSRTTS